MRLLDLFCGAGGAAMGYHRAGFDTIVGVDIKPQPRYPFTFVQGDALEYVKAHGHEFDVIHASPPCQGYSIMRNLPWLRHKEYPLLIGPTVEVLESIRRPYVIENVMGAKAVLSAGWLCGQMFGLPFFRHRLFASNVYWLAPAHEKHVSRIKPSRLLGERARKIIVTDDGRRVERRGLPGHGLTIPRGLTAWCRQSNDAYGHQTNGARRNGANVGHAAGVMEARVAMGCEWMKRDELTQAIPPVYTEFIGRQLLQALDHERAHP